MPHPDRRISLLALVALVACGGPSAQTEPRFVAVHNALSSMGMAQTGPINQGSLPEGAKVELEVELRGGECYTFIALGSDGVQDIGLRVVDGTGTEIGRDVTHDRQAAARVCAESTGFHTAVVEMTEGEGAYLVSSWSGATGGGGGFSGPMVASGSGGGTCGAPIDLAFGEPLTGDTTGGPNVTQAPCAQGDSPERVHRFELEQRAQVAISLQSTFDGALYLLRTCGDVSTMLDCNDDAPDTTHSRIDTTLEPGTYYLVVDGYGTEAGSYTLEASITPLRPVQEVCNDAQALRVGQPASASTQGAADYFQATCADGARMPDRVYFLDVNQRSRMRVRQQSDHDGALYIRSSCTDPTTEIGCNDDYRDTRGSLITQIVDPGRYFVYADGFGSGGQIAAGNYTLTGDLAPENGGGVQNDDCGGAVDAQVGAAFEVDTFQARDDQAGSCGGQGSADVVYDLRIQSRSEVKVKVRDAEFDGAVYLRSNCAQAGSEVACANIPISVPRTQEVTLEATVDPGSYSLIIDGARPDSFGAAQVEVEVRDLAAVQRMCRQAPLLRPGRTVNGSTAGESNDFQASCAEGARSGDVVYRIQLRRRSRVKVEMTSDYDGALHLRSDCASAGTEVACNDDVADDNRRSQIEATLDRGTYFLFVDGFREGSEGSFSVELDVSNP
ncbi:MAG: hypothetical protein JJ863_19120 [Deltaproteobacteria bacterium]|nr:hypothetical protein [Deltaproteobacteria bacterium]